jgi:hypothetical protein
MANTDENQMSDSVRVELNGRAIGDPDPLPDKPDDTSDRDEWVDYVVALGADRNFVENETEHWDSRTEAYVTEPALETEQLKALAERLGG